MKKNLIGTGSMEGGTAQSRGVGLDATIVIVALLSTVIFAGIHRARKF